MRILLATENQSLSVLIKRSFNRFRYEWDQVDNGFDAFQKAITNTYDLILLEFDLPRMSSEEILRRFGGLENFQQPPVIILTKTEDDRSVIEQQHFSRTQVISRPLAIRSLVGTVQQMLHTGTRIACLGGGTGLFTLLSGLKTLSAVQLYSIVSMSDDGGSTGRLRDMFGILPPGDIRRSLVALSTAPDLLNQLVNYRFDRGKELKGHNLGNLLLTALAEMQGSMSGAVKAIGEILNIQGHVIPVTEAVNTLKAELSDGKVIEGEASIDQCEGRDHDVRIQRLWQEPKVRATPDAIEALYNAQYIILGPGDLFTSLISNLIVEGVAEAICSSAAKKIYICNVMTKPGETSGFDVADHVREINRYLGRDVLDYILCSSNQEFKKASLENYRKKQQEPVLLSSEESLKEVSNATLIRADVAAEEELVRHDSLKLAAVIKKMIED